MFKVDLFTSLVQEEPDMSLATQSVPVEIREVSTNKGRVAIISFKEKKLNEEKYLFVAFEYISTLVKKGCHNFVFNLGNLELFGKIALGKVFGLNKEVGKYGGIVTICNPPPSAEEMLRICAIGILIPITKDEEEALNMVTSRPQAEG